MLEGGGDVGGGADRVDEWNKDVCMYVYFETAAALSQILNADHDSRNAPSYIQV